MEKFETTSQPFIEVTCVQFLGSQFLGLWQFSIHQPLPMQCLTIGWLSTKK